MKRFLVLFSLLPGFLMAQFGYQWMTPFMASTSGLPGYGQGHAILADAAGNVYSTGEFGGGFIDFNPLGSAYSVGGAVSDAYVVKQDASGNLLWMVRIGGSSIDLGRGIALDNAGNVFVCGVYSGTVDFDPSSATYTLTAASQDIFIAKYSNTGSLLWAQSIGGSSFSSANGIAVDPSGDVYTTGFYGGSVDFDPGAGTYSLTSNGSSDVFICKLSAAGTFVWARSFGSPSGDEGHGIIVNGTDLYLCGEYEGLIDLDPGPGTFTATISGTQENIFVSKFDLSGNFVWAATAGNTSQDIAYGITADASGNVLITGQFNGIVDFDPGPAVNNLASTGPNLFIWKLNASGSYVWAKDVGSSKGTSITTDAFRKIYITGHFSGSSIDFDPGPGVLALSSPAPGINSFILKLDSTGNAVSVLGFGGSGNEEGHGIAIDLNGTVYSTGYFSSPTSFIPGSSSTTVAPTGSSATYNLKLCQRPVTPTAIQTGSALACIGTPIVFTVDPVPLATQYAWGAPGWTGTTTTTSVSINTASFYPNSIISVNAQNACGSSQSFTISVPIAPLPTVSVNSGTICSGQSFVLVPSGAASYTFSGASATVSPAMSTTYQVVGTSTAGCVSGSAATSSVTVKPSPTITVNSGTVCNGNLFNLNPGGATSYSTSGLGTIVSPSITTSYTVVGMGNGCTSAPVVATVTVSNLPLPVISANDGSICAGQTFTISPSGALTYTFSSGSPIVSPGNTSIYFISGTSSLGCISASAKIITVTVRPLPTLTITSQTATICPNQVASITVSGANTYLWSDNSTGSVIAVSPAGTTEYTVSGTSAFGCTNQKTVTQYVAESCAGLTDQSILNTTRVFPNPSGGEVTIDCSADLEIFLFNALGQLMLAEKLDPGQNTLLLEMPSGVYFLEMNYKGGSIKRKLIKN